MKEAGVFDEIETDCYGNVIGHIKGKNPGPKVLFDGHIDTVPVGNLKDLSLIHIFVNFKNILTGEKLCQMTIECNDIQFDVCINCADLLGEPAVGRRFKGLIWLQGQLHF